MSSNIPAVLALGPGWGQVVVIAIAVVFPVLNWIYKTAKGENGPGGSQPRRGQGSGATPQQLARARQEELRRLSQQRLNVPGSPSGKPAAKQEKTARELARELYQQRADALRAQLATPPAARSPEALRSTAAARQVPAGQPVNRGGEQISILRPRPSPLASMKPPAVQAKMLAPGVPVPRVERGDRMPPPRGVRPAAPPVRRPPPPRQAAPQAPVRQAAPQAAAPSTVSGTVGVAGTTTATIRGLGGRPAILLRRDSMREAIILREVLDRPLALREPAMPL